MTQTDLTAHDAYALARALVGMSWDSLQLSSAVGLLLAHLDPNVPDDLRFLRKVLGQELLRAVLAVDPNAPPPLLPQRTADLNIVPELPASAKLTDAQLQQASECRDVAERLHRGAGSAANETRGFSRRGLYWLRLLLDAGCTPDPVRQQVFPTSIWVVAVSTYYRNHGFELASEVRGWQSAPANAASGLARELHVVLGVILPPNSSDIRRWIGLD